MAQIVGKEEDLYLGALMAKSQRGDAVAYEEILKRTAIFLKRFLANRIQEPHGLDEVVQETLISVHEYRNTFDIERSFASWAFAIASNRVIDHFRRSRRHQDREVDAETSDLETQHVAEDGSNAIDERMSARDKLREVLDLLSDKQREVVILLKIEGLSIREAADRLGMSEGAVKVNAHRAYEKLRGSKS